VRGIYRRTDYRVRWKGELKKKTAGALTKLRKARGTAADAGGEELSVENHSTQGLKGKGKRITGTEKRGSCHAGKEKNRGGSARRNYWGEERGGNSKGAAVDGIERTKVKNPNKLNIQEKRP